VSNKQKGRIDKTRDPRIGWFTGGSKHQFDQRACDRHHKLANECWCRGNRALHDKALPEFQKCTCTHYYLGRGRWSEEEPEGAVIVQEESA
jgi:hypothetical protein